MTFEVFTKLRFIVRSSWEDLDLASELRCEGIETSCAGYCEWEAEATSTVSVGWAWFVCAKGRHTIAPGGISTNVMLVAHKTRYDLGDDRTAALLQGWLAGEHWAADESDTCWTPSTNMLS